MAKTSILADLDPQSKSANRYGTPGSKSSFGFGPPDAVMIWTACKDQR